MNPPTTCPADDLLVRLAAGQILSQEAEAFLSHLESCARCTARVQQLSMHDTLADLLSHADTQSSLPEQPRLETLTAVLADLRLSAAAWQRSDADAAACRHGESVVQAIVRCMAPAESADELGRLGGYRVLGTLGQGGMGVVFSAQDVALQRRVALKTMKPELAAHEVARLRFLREARATAAIEHRHIVTIHQVGEDRGIPFLAMQHLEGESLAQRIRRSGKLPLADVLRIGRQVAEGLSAAHQRDLVHRDIKPANVFLAQESDLAEPTAKILDFGLAWMGDDAQLTHSGSPLGTPSYMAPEQACSSTSDARSDLFSLGCMLYQMSTGQLPFVGSHPLAVLMAVAEQDPTPPSELDSDVPGPLSDLILRLLAKQPEGRPASAMQVAFELRQLEADLLPPGPTARSATVARDDARHGARWFRRKRTWLGGWLVPTLVAVAVLVPLGYLFAGTLFRIVTNKGILVIKTDDADVVVRTKENGAIVVLSGTQQEIELAAGDQEIEIAIKDGDKTARFVTRKFEILRGGESLLDVALESLPRVAAAESEKSPPADSSPAGSSLERGQEAFAAFTLDHLQADQIPPAERFDWQPEELVAVFGEHGRNQWITVLDIGFDPSGEFILSRDENKTYVWSARDGSLCSMERGDDYACDSPRGDILAGTVGVYSIDSQSPPGKWMRLTRKFPTRAGLATLSPDGKFVATASVDRVAIVDLRDGDARVVTSVVAEGAAASTDDDLVFSADGRRLLWASGRINVWDFDGDSGPKPSLRLTASFDPSVDSYPYGNNALSADGRQLFETTQSGLKVWEIKTDPPVVVETLESQRHIAVSPDGNWLVTAPLAILYRRGEDHWERQGNVNSDFANVTSVAFDQHSQRLALGGLYGEVQVVNIPDGKSLFTADRAKPITEAGFSASGRILGLGRYHSKSFVDLSTEDRAIRTLAGSPDVGRGNPAPKISPDDRFALVGHVGVWNLAEPDHSLPGLVTANGARWGFSSKPGVLWRMVPPNLPPAMDWIPWEVTPRGALRLGDVERTWAPVDPIPKPHVAYQSNDQVLAIVADDGRLQIWTTDNADRPRHVLEMPKELDGIPWVAVSPNIDLVAAWPYNHSYIWVADLSETSLRWQNITVGGQGISDVVFSPDGGLAIVAHVRGISICDWPRNLILREIPFPGPVLKLLLHPDGRHVATLNGNGTVYVLRLPELAK